MKILFFGDLFLGGICKWGKKILSNELSQLINSADYAVFNLECVLFNSALEKRKDKSSILTFEEDDLKTFIQDIQSEKLIFSLSNNHINDLGEGGIIGTKNILQKYGICYFGAGKKEEAEMPYIINEQLGLLAYSSTSFETNSIKATSSRQGVTEVNMENLIYGINLLNQKNIKNKFVILHTGREYVPYPKLEERQFSKAILEYGVNYIICHHPHIIRGCEEYMGKKIFYSLGNFLFPNFYSKNGYYHRWSKINNYSIAFEVNFIDECIVENLIGIKFDYSKKQVVLDQKSLSFLENYSQPFKRTDQSYYDFHETKYVKLIRKKILFERNIIARLFKYLSKVYYNIWKCAK